MGDCAPPKEVVWVVLLVGGGEARGFAITSESLEALWRAHAAGLAVHPWTVRAKNYFLPKSLWKGAKSLSA